MTSCSCVSYQYFGWTYRFHFQGRFAPVDESDMFLRNIGKHLHRCTTLSPRRSHCGLLPCENRESRNGLSVKCTSADRVWLTAEFHQIGCWDFTFPGRFPGDDVMKHSWSFLLCRQFFTTHSLTVFSIWTCQQFLWTMFNYDLSVIRFNK
jgi:hypothetical protein